MIGRCIGILKGAVLGGTDDEFRAALEHAIACVGSTPHGIEQYQQTGIVSIRARQESLGEFIMMKAFRFLRTRIARNHGL